MSGIIDPPKIIVATLTINNYRYALSNFIPHTSVVYGIDCFNDTTLVKSITGLLEGEQYKEWTTDDWLDRFIKQKVEELSDVETELCVEQEVPVDPEPVIDPVPVIEQEIPVDPPIVDPVPIVEPVPVIEQEIPVDPVPIVEPVPVIEQEIPVDPPIVESELPLETV